MFLSPAERIFPTTVSRRVCGPAGRRPRRRLCSVTRSRPSRCWPPPWPATRRRWCRCPASEGWPASAAPPAGAAVSPPAREAASPPSSSAAHSPRQPSSGNQASWNFEEQFKQVSSHRRLCHELNGGEMIGLMKPWNKGRVIVGLSEPTARAPAIVPAPLPRPPAPAPTGGHGGRLLRSVVVETDAIAVAPCVSSRRRAGSRYREPPCAITAAAALSMLPTAPEDAALPRAARCRHISRRCRQVAAPAGQREPCLYPSTAEMGILSGDQRSLVAQNGPLID